MMKQANLATTNVNTFFWLFKLRVKNYLSYANLGNITEWL